MIDLGRNSHCVCRQFNNSQQLCVNQHTIREQGKSVKLTPAVGEQVKQIFQRRLNNCVTHEMKGLNINK